MRATVPTATIKRIGKRGVAIWLPLTPVPASRPRVTKWGTYHTPKYARWAKDALASLREARVLKVNKAAMFHVTMDVVCPPFKTVKRPCPRGDIDNYAKATLDVLTKWGGLWNDDNQVVTLDITKRFTVGDEAPHIHILIERSCECL